MVSLVLLTPVKGPLWDLSASTRRDLARVIQRDPVNPAAGAPDRTCMRLSRGPLDRRDKHIYALVAKCLNVSDQRDLCKCEQRVRGDFSVTRHREDDPLRRLGGWFRKRGVLDSSAQRVAGLVVVKQGVGRHQCQIKVPSLSSRSHGSMP